MVIHRQNHNNVIAFFSPSSLDILTLINSVKNSSQELGNALGIAKETINPPTVPLMKALHRQVGSSFVT